MFWASDVRSDRFAWEAKPEVRALARDWHDLERLPKDALLLIHHSMGNDVISQVAKLPQRKAVVYHNITPSHYFAGLNEHARRYSELGRAQLKELAAVAEFGFADSEFNRQELEEAGLAKTAVVPILYDWEAFDVTPDPVVTRRLADERTAILAVGQILPQKAIHDVAAGFAAYRRRAEGPPLELVGRGRERLADSSRENVRERLRLALALGGYELPEERKRRIVVLSSDQRCGIHHYSLAVCEGLRKNGHHVTFVGVRHQDTADLQHKLRYIRDDVDTILIEHEAGIFRDVPFVRALWALKRRGFPVVLSMHELEPEKFHHYRRLSA